MHPIALMAATPIGRRVAAAGAAGLVGVAALVFSVSSSMTAAVAAPMNGLPCPAGNVAVGDGDGQTGLNAKQIHNAQIIIGVGQAERIPTRGHVVAIATALQESRLRNISYGDRDSLGLFQQRPSQGWGTPQQVRNPAYAARKFYSRLQKVRGWEQMTVTEAAQAVQRSGFPDAYAQHEARAVQIVASIGQSTAGGGVTQVDPTGCTDTGDRPSGAAGKALSVMLQQVGDPYVWGATGPDSFDCSGLIVYGWRKAGYQLGVRTSQQMYDVTTPVKADQVKPGDLIYSRFQADGPAHVMIVVKQGLAVEAAKPGTDVRVRKYDAKAEKLRFGRLPKSAMQAAT